MLFGGCLIQPAALSVFFRVEPGAGLCGHFASLASQFFAGQSDMLVDAPFFLVRFCGQAVIVQMTYGEHFERLSAFKADDGAQPDGMGGIRGRLLMLKFRVVTFAADIAQVVRDLVGKGNDLCGAHRFHSCLPFGNLQGQRGDRFRFHVVVLRHSCAPYGIGVFSVAGETVAYIGHVPTDAQGKPVPDILFFWQDCFPLPVAKGAFIFQALSEEVSWIVVTGGCRTGERSREFGTPREGTWDSKYLVPVQCIF